MAVWFYAQYNDVPAPHVWIYGTRYPLFMIGDVSVTGNRQPISSCPLPAVAMIAWHVARH